MPEAIELTEAVTYEVRGHFAIITINRPLQRNAVNGAVAAGIESAVDLVEDDDEIRIGVLAGTPPVFCAGADLKEINKGNGALLGTKRGGFAGFVRRDRTKPIIAAVEGPALAGGTEIVLACDLVVASEGASFGIPEVKRSLVAAAGGLFRLGRKIPLNIAMECALTGDPIDAEAAHRYGLVNVLVREGNALTASFELAGRVCANAPVAVRASRHVVLTGTHAPDGVGWKLSAEASAQATTSADFREGLSAFIEKRTPCWTGH
ncbi:MAG TPA: crotonase/enoyl-CoA hydratase family protein [Acidimicrobiales bacterium]